MTDSSFLRTVAACLALFVLFGCGTPAPIERVVDTNKIPITTCSEKALDAFLKGRWLFDNLRVTDAHEYFQKAAEADSNFALAHLQVALSAPTVSERFDAFRRAVDASEHASEGERFLIAAYEAAVAGEPEIQHAKLQALVALFPRDERAHNELGNFLYFNQQDYEGAISAYRASIDINPAFTQPYNMLGYSLRFVGDYAAAEEAFRRYAELVPDQPNPYDSYAELLMKMGRFEESIAGYEKALAIDPNFVASFIGIGNNRMFMGRFEDARAAFSEIETIARNDRERRAICIWRAVSYLHEGDFENAIDEIQSCYDIAAETDDRGSMSADLNFLGDISLHSGRADEAAERYRAQIDMIESSDVTDEVKEAAARNQKYDLARVALSKGDLGTASVLAAEYREAVEARNVRLEIQRTHELEAMIAIAEGDPDQAVDHLEKGDQQDPQIWLLKARAHRALGDADAARLACEHVINFNQFSINLAFVRNTARELLESL
jgi:tetratricopeptide (TPR) repeat protein